MILHVSCSYEFVVSDDRVYGSALPNGSWTGLIGMLQRGVSRLPIHYFNEGHPELRESRNHRRHPGLRREGDGDPFERDFKGVLNISFI